MSGERLEHVSQLGLRVLDDVDLAYELALDIVVHDVDALALLALVQILLGHLELILGVVELLLHLASLHVHAVDHLGLAVLLALQLLLPEVDVVDALAELLVRLVLILLGELLALARQSLRVGAQAFGRAAHLVRGHVVVHLRLIPVLGRVACVESVARRRKQQRHLDRVNRRQVVARIERPAHLRALVQRLRRVHLSIAIVGGRSPRQVHRLAEYAAVGRRRAGANVLLADGGQVGARLGTTAQVRVRCSSCVTEIIHVVYC